MHGMAGAWKRLRLLTPFLAEFPAPTFQTTQRTVGPRQAVWQSKARRLCTFCFPFLNVCFELTWINRSLCGSSVNGLHMSCCMIMYYVALASGFGNVNHVVAGSIRTDEHIFPGSIRKKIKFSPMRVWCVELPPAQNAQVAKTTGLVSLCRNPLIAICVTVWACILNTSDPFRKRKDGTRTYHQPNMH